MYVNVPWTDSNTDTKNTAGSTNSSSKLFLIGATSQAANPQTYSHDTAYVGTDGCLYSNSTKVSVEGHTHSYLPLSGGTLTGNFAANSNTKTPFNLTTNLYYVNKSLSWGTSSYLRNVILLIPVQTSTNWSGYNYIDGKFLLWKSGGNMYDIVEVNLNNVYNVLEYRLLASGQHSSSYKLCICKYNGVNYYAIDCPYHANPYNNAEFYGHIRSSLTGGTGTVNLPLNVDYYNENTQTVLNSEVRDSITSTLTTSIVTSVNSRNLFSIAGFSGSLSGNASSATKLGTDAGSATNPVYFSGGKPVACTYSLSKSVPSDAKFTDTTYSAGSGLSLSGTTFNHSSTVTAGTAGTSSATSGSTIAIPYVTVNATGHVTGYGTHTHTVSGFAASSHSHSTYVLKAGDVMTGPLRFERPTSSNNNYNEGARFNLGGAGSWAGFTIGNAAGSTEGNSEGAYAFLVNNKKFYIRHKDTEFLTVDTSKNVLWNPGLFAIVTGQTECGIRFRVASSSGDFVGRYSTYVSLFNANNPYSEIKINDSNNEVMMGVYNQKNRVIVNGIGNAAGFYSQIYAASPNEASITFSNSSLQSDANFFTVGMTHSDNLFWVHSGKKAGRILIGDGNGYLNIPNRLAIGTTTTPSYPLQVSGQGHFSDRVIINKSAVSCALELLHTNSNYAWNWIRQVSNGKEWHIGVCSNNTDGTDKINSGAYEIRSAGESFRGIFVRYDTSSYGKLVVANNSNTETSIGYLNTNHSSTYPVWTVGCGIGTGVKTFGWWYQPANGSGGACKMYLGESGDLHITTLYIGSDAITFTT